jgi:enoyl-CoA hydratase/carnithine racemase
MTNTTIAKQIRLTRQSPAYWRVTFDHPPLNIFGPETIPQLNEIITALEIDDEDIASAVVYLTEARQITGEVLHVDGGAHNDKW